MPFSSAWVPPETYLEHNEVTIYRAYKNNDLEDPLTFHFSTVEVEDDDGVDDSSFDVRDLPNLHKHDYNTDEGRKAILRDAIEGKYLPRKCPHCGQWAQTGRCGNAVCMAYQHIPECPNVVDAIERLLQCRECTCPPIPKKEPELPKVPERIILVVQRVSNEEWTHAIVSCLKDRQVSSPEQLLPLIRDAVTIWVNTTTEGWTAWADSVEDFNVGDLSQQLSDSTLQHCLEAQGIHDLQIETVVHDRHLWTYDTVLVDETKLRAND